MVCFKDNNTYDDGIIFSKQIKEIFYIQCNQKQCV